ncbi:right-handed parallel beta-helix repeat-containing protein [Chitinophaga solisilvae]|uniref:Right-handed parallel beta-helix repeat-containing protein n=1 Tax=Chitinophaga solisilvae TaxID=1233460 RepID=A0A9Q5GTQ4_9BACT|nr:right-handed parallel beta-helix repeat-containing protein [Chitinophaga solisilvae]NSL88249.1 right-handed parallel beta-helix repeat-containing protein [Chitinophaga solisilvae]
MKKHYINMTLISIVAALFFTLESCKKDLNEMVTPPPVNPDTSVVITPPVKGKEYTLAPDRYGRLVIEKTNIYKPGDVINLKGDFTAIYIENLIGKPGAPITVRNLKGTVTTIGNTEWDSGSWATALAFNNCRYIRVGSENSKSEFIINGSVKPGRQAYMDLTIGRKSDNFEVRNMTIKNGGTGIWAKTDPVKGDPSTYYPNARIENLYIHDVLIDGTWNEGMYIGHTATYFNLSTNLSYYGDPSTFTPGQEYTQPILWYNVKIYNNIVQNGGADGIQTSAIDKLEVYNNTVTNWGNQKNPSHCGGILIGGRTLNTNVHDNIVQKGWGELIQFYGSGENGATHIINNNLLSDNIDHDGISMRGTAGANVQITNNTIARLSGVAIRLNGYRGMTKPVVISGNALIAPRITGGALVPSAYIYTEGGGVFTEGANAKMPNLEAAGVDPNNYYQPMAGSAIGNNGYRKR